MLITNFASGELSPTLNGRIDLQQYYQGAGELTNFDIIPTGGIKRRVGTEFIGELHGNCRLISFIVDSNTSFVLEFIPGKIYIWHNGQKVQDIEQNDIYITTDYENLTEIKEIQFAQNYDTLVFVQKNHRPLELKYNFSELTFEKIESDFNFVPEVQLDDEDGYIVIAEENLPEPEFDGQFCILNGILYKWNESESKWETYTLNPEQDDELFTTEGKYPGCVTFFNNRLWFASTQDYCQRIYASAAPTTKDTQYHNFATYKSFITVGKSLKNMDLHIITGNIIQSNANRAQGDGTYRTTITSVSQDLTQEGLLEKDITEYYLTNIDLIPVGSKIVSVTNNTIIFEHSTVFPISEDKIAQVFNVSLWKNTMQATAEDYEYNVVARNMTTSDCSFFLELASDQNDGIKWLASGKQLVVGTESSVYNIPATVTALSISAEMNGRYGSDFIQALPIADAVIFLAQGKKGVREYYYSPQEEAFKTNNIAIFAEHLLQESAIVDFDYMTNPYNKLLLTRTDGKIAVMLYDKTNGIMGWYRIQLGSGSVKSLCTIRGTQDKDIIYVAVERNNNYYLERIDGNNEKYLDSWKIYSLGDEMTINGGIIINTMTKEELNLSTCTAEELEAFTDTEDELIIGYEYESKVRSMPIIANDPTGKKRITSLITRFLNSYMPQLRCNDRTQYFTHVTEPYSGIKSIDYAGDTERDVTFELTYSKSNPCTILAINATLA